MNENKQENHVVLADLDKAHHFNALLLCTLVLDNYAPEQRVFKIVCRLNGR